MSKLVATISKLVQAISMLFPNVFQLFSNPSHNAFHLSTVVSNLYI